MRAIALQYMRDYGDDAIKQFVKDLMEGDPITLKQGYSKDNAIIAAAEAFAVPRAEIEHLLALTKLATITLYIDVEQFEQDAGEKLTPTLLHEIGMTVNNDATGILGYGSWQIGWAEFREDGYVTREFLEPHDYMESEE